MKKIKYLVFKIIRFFVSLFYSKPTFIGEENLPDVPCLIIGNHTQMNGPIIGELYYPRNDLIWCASQMMVLKEVPAYSYKDFWSRKPKWTKWFYKALSYIIAPFSVCLFQNAKTIAVYHDKRILKTFKHTVNGLESGKDIIIFPEHDEPHNNIICDFQEGFVDVARTYYKSTGKAVSFVPMYIAPKLKKCYFGKPISYDPSNSMREERSRICKYLMNEITEIAVSLPKHIVIPYNNIPKKEYRHNTDREATVYEKTGS